MDYADAFDFLAGALRGRPVNAVLDLWKELDRYVYEHEQQVAQAGQVQTRTQQISPLFLQAAWDLALLGVLRLGVAQIPDSADFDGTKYRVTEYGARWASEGDEEAFVPIGSETFVALLEPFSEFGAEFIERAREAARWRKSKAYLACCVMCGAAAEAVLLSVAIAKIGNRESVLATYNAKAGRRKIEMLVSGNIRTELKETLSPLFTLVKYWRDQASHGAAAQINQG